MTKAKENEILLALKEHSMNGGDCFSCPYQKEPFCHHKLCKDTLELLKAQESETSNEPKPDDDVGCWYDITHKYTLEQVVSALKEQEPRVMALEDLQRVQENEAPVWFESRGTWHGMEGFWIFVYEITPEMNVMRYNAAHMCEYGWLGLGAYNKTWRVWTSRPTDAQREARSWD